MGLWTIDEVTIKENESRERRRHERRQWMIALAEITFLAAFIAGTVWLGRWLGII